MARRAHRWRGRLLCGIWPVCVRCGLVWLKNKVSQKAARQLCPEEDADE